MFDLFGKSKHTILEPQPLWKSGPEPEEEPHKSTRKEAYRVGTTDDGWTTLTFLNSGSSMTLSMNRDACEKLIRMLRATYDETTPTEGEDNADA